MVLYRGGGDGKERGMRICALYIYTYVHIHRHITLKARFFFLSFLTYISSLAKRLREQICEGNLSLCVSS